MPSTFPRSAALVGGLLVLSLAPPASAAPAGGGWQEAHRSGDDVRIVVAPDGTAVVEHHVRYRVVAGRFRSFELVGVDARAEVSPEARVVAEGAPDARARVEPSPKTPGALRVTMDEPKGLPRGAYTIDVGYKLDLVVTKALVRDGAMWRLAWTAPVAPEGMDGARVVFDLPAAATEPRLAASEQSATTIATARRTAERDELELVRARVPRGEAVTWAIRVDPKAFPAVVAPELRPPPSAVAPPPPPSRAPMAMTAAALALVAGLLAYARRAKGAAVARACAAASVLPRPLLPLPATVAPFAFGAAAVLALAAFLWGSASAGSALLVLAMALATFRAPRVVARPRGPGRWAEVEDAEVLVRRPREARRGDALDIGTASGKRTAALAALAVLGLAMLARGHVAYAHVALPLAATALVPLFVTGTRAQLPPSAVDLAVRVLGPARDALASAVDLAHVELVPIARLREGTRTPDEVRLACAPRIRVPGLRVIELALATSPAAPDAVLPEVLVRYDDGSASAAKIAALAPGLPVVPGRTPEEKVLRVSPRIPTAAGAARLVARLLGELEGRRSEDREAPPLPFEGVERRGRRPSPGVRAAAPARATPVAA